MPLRSSYRLMLLLSAILYLAFWFSPWAYGYLSEETGGVLSYGGYGAWIELPALVSYGLLSITIFGYLGAFYFRRAFLWMLIGTFGIELSLWPLLGLSVITGVEVLVTDLSVFLRGGAVALALLSPLREEFY